MAVCAGGQLADVRERQRPPISFPLGIRLSFLSALNMKLVAEELINMATCTTAQFCHNSVSVPFEGCLKAVIQQIRVSHQRSSSPTDPLIFIFRPVM